MKAQLTGKGRDLARRLTKAQNDLQAIRNEPLPASMTLDQRDAWVSRLIGAAIALGEVRGELSAAILDGRKNA